jgi:hypothetical protein
MARRKGLRKCSWYETNVRKMREIFVPDLGEMR